MNTLKTIITITFFSLLSSVGFASSMKATCAMSDSRFVESTDLVTVVVDNVLGSDAASNFPEAPKHDETMITDDYVTMAFTNEVSNYYVFSLERKDVQAAIASGSGQAYAEIRFSNKKTAVFEQYLREGQLLKTFGDCILELVD